ncbi:hypothetical protein [Streptomyces cinereoruber]|uniref:hypothetical protein n=1 Tax=Streptomyces cinereoruber TaxID=67260 RepID=UPI003640F21D
MRDAIARALSWALSLLVPRRPGRHSAAVLATLGVDWPYGYDGDQFAALAAAATAVPA